MSVVSRDTIFLGYRRENGRVGVRNFVVVLPLDDLSNAAAEAECPDGNEGVVCTRRARRTSGTWVSTGRARGRTSSVTSASVEVPDAHTSRQRHRLPRSPRTTCEPFV